MVRVLASIALACSRAVAALPSGRSTPVVDIKDGIANIATHVNDLNTQINSFPVQGGSLMRCLAIHAEVVKLEIALKNGINNVERTGPLDEEDGAELLERMRGILSTTLNALQAIVAKKAAFEALILGAATHTVREDIFTLYSCSIALGDALVAVAPDSLKDDSGVVKAAFEEAFLKALAVYDSA